MVYYRSKHHEHGQHGYHGQRCHQIPKWLAQQLCLCAEAPFAEDCCVKVIEVHLNWRSKRWSLTGATCSERQVMGVL